MESVDLASILTGDDPTPCYLVEGLLYTGQMVIVAGEPGVGKSFLQYHISMCVALGLPVLGLPSKKGSVLYFDEENARPDLQQYLRWIWRGLGHPDIDTLKQGLFLQHFALARRGQKRFAYMAEAAAQVKPSLIVVDTVTPCCAIQDENDNSEASKAMQALRIVKEAAGPDTTMVLLKHSKFSHDPKEKLTIRGAKAWLGECDAVIYHRLAIGRPRTDGLRNSRLLPDKVRAFGLRKEIVITPEWMGEGKQKGIRLG